IPFRSETIRDWSNALLPADIKVFSGSSAGVEVLWEGISQHVAILTDSGSESAEQPQCQCVNIMLGNRNVPIRGMNHVFKFGKYPRRSLADFTDARGGYDSPMTRALAMRAETRI